MSFIIFENPSDSTKISIMSPTGELPISELIARYVDTTKPYKICIQADISDLDPDFADAWQLHEDVITVNMTNAKNDWRNKLRQERLPLLQQLDIQYMRALELNDTVKAAEIATQKQKLRDAPSDPRIEEATTTAELKLLTLDSLTPHQVPSILTE